MEISELAPTSSTQSRPCKLYALHSAQRRTLRIPFCYVAYKVSSRNRLLQKVCVQGFLEWFVLALTSLAPVHEIVFFAPSNIGVYDTLYHGKPDKSVLSA